MDELARDLEAARQELTPAWTEERSARLYAGVRQVGRRRAARRATLLSVCALSGVALIGFGIRRHAQGPAAPQADAASSAHAAATTGNDAERSGHTLRLADGSRAELVGEQSELEVIHNSPGRVDLRLLTGRAHFEVVHDALRSFVVEATPYRVEVIGTSFDVERAEREVSVGVKRGKVRVYGPQGAEDLVAGQIKHFALRPAVEPGPAAEPAAESEQAGEEEQSARSTEHPRIRARAGKRAAWSSWRSLSQSGQYEAAFESLRQSKNVDDDPAALMDAADAARLSGHPADAVQYLLRVVSVHRRSPVAPLAAFTLGRVYLDQLGQPERAAEAFDLSLRLAPSGSLAQDALAREVEALSKGGNAQAAYAHAQQYLQRYPNGRRLRAVQLYGGLE